MSGLLPQLVLVGLLVLLNAAFAGTELALVSLRESQLKILEQRSATGAVLARLVREPNRFLATIQIGITLAGFLASAAAAVSLAAPLEDLLSVLGGAAQPVAVLAVTLMLAYVTLVFGELAPKRVAMQRAERWGLLAARPLAVMATLTRPVVWLLSRSTDLAVRMMGGDPTLQREEVTEEELRDLVAIQQTFTDQQRMIIDGAFEVAQRSLQNILRPRSEVLSLSAQEPTSLALERLAESGHSRAPVTATGSLDDVVGLVHLRDLVLGEGRSVGEVAADICAFPETLGVLDALHEMQVERAQLAVVVDEHGSVEGIVTLEDLVEEFVGDIYDETDRELPAVVTERDGAVLLPGSFPVHDLAALGIGEIPDGSYATVAGLVLDRLNRLPEAPGDIVVVGEWELEVTAVGRRAITEVRVRRAGTDSNNRPSR